MQILGITLRNIKSHRNLELRFVSGINVLSGPNGVGKSTIFEAIGYALFGVDAKDFVGNIDRFLSIGSKKGEITVTFALDTNEIYRVSRGVGTGSKWLLAAMNGDCFEVEEHAGVQETESRIMELLGLDNGRPLADQFKMVIGPFQHDFLGPFILKQPVKRQEAFDEILGIDAWRKTYKGTRTLLTAVKNKMEILSVDIAGKKEQAKHLPERKKELQDLRAKSKERKKHLEDLEKQLATATRELLELDKQEKKLHTVRTEIQVLTNRLRDGEEKIAEQKQRVVEAEKAQALLEKNRSGKEAFEEAEKALQSLRDQEKKKKEIENGLTALDREQNRLAQAYVHELTEIEKIDKQLTEEEQRLQKERQDLEVDNKLSLAAQQLTGLRKEDEGLRSKIGQLSGKRAGLAEGQTKLTGGLCPFFKESCRNIAGKDFRDIFTTRLKAIDREILAGEKRLNELSTDIAAAEKAQLTIDAKKVRAEELSKQLLVIAKKRQENQSRRKQLIELEKLKAQAEEKTAAHKKELDAYRDLDARLTRFDKLRKQNQTARDIWFANLKDASDLTKRLESLQSMQQLFAELRQQLTDLKNTLFTLEKNYNPETHSARRLAREKLVSEVASLKQQIESNEKEALRLEDEITGLKRVKERIKKLSTEKKKLAEKGKLVDFMRTRIFNNVSSRLSERFREEISQRADTIYRTIAETDEALYWADRYRIVLRDMHDGEIRERSDDQLSGGQIMSAVVALRLALLQTIGAKVAFFDEPTSNLDAARRENLAHAFRAIDSGREEVTEHWYDQLFLISHDVAFTEITDQIITLD